MRANATQTPVGSQSVHSRVAARTQHACMHGPSASAHRAAPGPPRRSAWLQMARRWRPETGGKQSEHHEQRAAGIGHVHASGRADLPARRCSRGGARRCTPRVVAANGRPEIARVEDAGGPPSSGGLGAGDTRGQGGSRRGARAQPPWPTCPCASWRAWRRAQAPWRSKIRAVSIARARPSRARFSLVLRLAKASDAAARGRRGCVICI